MDSIHKYRKLVDVIPNYILLYLQVTSLYEDLKLVDVLQNYILLYLQATSLYEDMMLVDVLPNFQFLHIAGYRLPKGNVIETDHDHCEYRVF